MHVAHHAEEEAQSLKLGDYNLSVGSGARCGPRTLCLTVPQGQWFSTRGCIADMYIMIQNSSKTTVMRWR